MQFLCGRCYIAVVVDGKVQFYGKARLDELKTASVEESTSHLTLNL
jgi:hypothetical protein